MRKTRKKHKGNTLRNLHKVHTTENVLPRQNVLVQGMFQGQKRTPATALQGAFKWPKECPNFWTYFVSFTRHGSLDLGEPFLDRALRALRHVARLGHGGRHGACARTVRYGVPVPDHGNGRRGSVYP